MSGDVQPRKRKDKKKKKEESVPPFVYLKDEPPVAAPSGGNGGGSATPSPSAEEQIHIYKESRLGGNICAKIVFFLLLGTITVMVGIIFTEYHGSNEVATAPDSPWSQMLEGWIDDAPPDKHDEHDEVIADSGEHDEEEHAHHDDDDGGGDHHDEDEEDHDDEEEEHAVLEPEFDERTASNVASESKVSEEEEDEEAEAEGADDAEAGSEEDEDGHDVGGEEDQDEGEEEAPDLEGENEEEESQDNDEGDENEGSDGEEDQDQDQAQSAEDQEQDDEDRQGVHEEEFLYREIPGVTASAEELDENDEVDSAPGGTDQDEEDDINESTGEGSDAGYYSDNDDDGVEEEETGDDVTNNDDDEEADKNEDEDGNDKDENDDGYDDNPDNEENDSAENDEKLDFHSRGDQIEEEEEEESNILEDDKDDDDQDENSKVTDEYEEVEQDIDSLGATPILEGDDVSAEQLVESDDDFEEIIDPPEASEAAEGEESEGLDPTGVALKFGVGLAIIIVAHVVLVRKWNESDETGATTLNPTISPTAAVPRRQTLIPPSVNPSNLIPEPDDAEDYSDEDYEDEEDEDEEEDPVHAKIVREALVRKYNKGSPDASEDEELEDEELEEEEEIEDEEEEDEDNPEQQYDKRYGYKTAAVPLKQYSQEGGEEDEDEEVEEDEEEEEEGGYDLPARPWKNVRQLQESDPEVSDGEEISGSEDEPPPVIRRTGGPKEAEMGPEWPIGPDYPPDQQSTPSPPKPQRETPNFDSFEAQLEENPEAVLRQVKNLLDITPKEPILLSLEARALDKLAEQKHSNKFLEEAIMAYQSLLQGSDISDDLFHKTADRCINRMRFRGQHSQAIGVHKMLIARFPKEPKHRNDLAVSYLIVGRVSSAKRLLEETLQLWPSNGFAHVHYGFILKTTDNNNKEGARYMQAGIDSNEEGTLDARFLFHLGDAYSRLGEHSRSEEVYELGVRKGLFRSKYQRSLYNVDRLTARPWWTLQQTTYLKELRKFEERWKEIRDEGLTILQSHNKVNSFKDEAENLRDKGIWKQLELYARGQQIPANCKRAPITCQLIAQFPAAKSCRRGQAKFSVMQPNTHVWPHCGPTNCRLRAHLGLVVPPGTEIRVAKEKRSWEEGKMFVFDDSFEHEVWHNGSSIRLVLIVDIWHPELTDQERKTLPAI